MIYSLLIKSYIKSFVGQYNNESESKGKKCASRPSPRAPYFNITTTNYTKFKNS